jgi:hypothetical protein
VTSAAPRRARHSWRLLAGLAGLVVAGACGTTVPASPSAASPSPVTSASTPATVAPTPVPTPAPSVDSSAVYAEIEAEVEAIRGLHASRPVTRKVVDQATMTAVVTSELEEGNPPDLWAPTQRALQALGLLAPDASLETLYKKLLSSQTVGLYVPSATTLYVLSKAGALGPLERFTFSHEYDHALQDQAFGLTNLHVDAIGEGDRNLGRIALPEGDATLLMTQWAQQHLSAGDLIQLLAASNDPEQSQTLASMPSILRENLTFPYTVGLSFVSNAYANGGWSAVNRLYARPPDSTEQVLHPDKYAAHEAVLPIAIPADLGKRLGPGWSVPYTDSLGEFELRIWLRDVGKLAEADATNAAAGWGGDRLILATGPNDAWSLAVISRWDTPTDAAEFQSGSLAAARTLEKTGEIADVTTLPDGRVIFLAAPDRAAYATFAAALGIRG